ncbi:hypothetical protein F2P56_002271 [Juglans regia]|uniref:Reverse transcriptase domain-containing protein n=1 Tax=Juglans regia TaxID=51240 RepID=A0A833YBZ8_JUGRE|nr:hypothetical protein F2P56_002271 [Juglans regia]
MECGCGNMIEVMQVEALVEPTNCSLYVSDPEEEEQDINLAINKGYESDSIHGNTSSSKLKALLDLVEFGVGDHPWLVLGDFDIIREDKEQVGGRLRSSLAMEEFNACIDACGFVELSHYANLEYLNRKSSDHSPLVVKLSLFSPRYGPSPFKFQSMWCLNDTFQSCVKDAWERPLEGRLESLESQLQSNYSEDIESEYLISKLELEVWEKREKARLAQIVKKKWLKEGDKNSKFFHAVVNQRRRSSVISQMVLENGTVLSSPEAVHAGAVEYFREFLSEPMEMDRVADSKSFEKFWPISLCSVTYKIFSKIIVSRLTRILPRLISLEQGAFIPGRSIFENISLAQEMVQGLKKKTWGGNVMVKIEMAKAYDREVLSRLLRQKFESGGIGKFYHPRGSPLVSHLLYADDVLVFLNGMKCSMQSLMFDEDICCV